MLVPDNDLLRISALINHEQVAVANSKNVYLGGFSEGGQLASYVQLVELNYALGGVIVMDGFPLPPLIDMPGHSRPAAQKNSSYCGEDMRWMIWWGDQDPIFPVTLSMSTFAAIFDVLGISSTLKINHTEPDMTHTLIKPEFEALVSFVRGDYD